MDDYYTLGYFSRPIQALFFVCYDMSVSAGEPFLFDRNFVSKAKPHEHAAKKRTPRVGGMYIEFSSISLSQPI